MYQRWLSAFHAVARSGGFTAAAKLLNIGQPTVSMHVSALEDHFGVELFHRRGRRVELTALGKELLTITEGLFGHEEEAIELLRAVQARETGSLRIGAVRPLDAMEICARLLKQYPNLRLAVEAVSAEADVLNGLLNFDFDAGVIGDPTDDPRFFSSFYKRYRINIIAHVDHPLARRRTIRIKDLEEQRVIQRTGGAFDRALKEAGVNIQPILETIEPGRRGRGCHAGHRGRRHLGFRPRRHQGRSEPEGHSGERPRHVHRCACRLSGGTPRPAVDRELSASRQCGDAQPSQGAALNRCASPYAPRTITALWRGYPARAFSARA